MTPPHTNDVLQTRDFASYEYVRQRLTTGESVFVLQSIDPKNLMTLLLKGYRRGS